MAGTPMRRAGAGQLLIIGGFGLGLLAISLFFAWN